MLGVRFSIPADEKGWDTRAEIQFGIGSNRFVAFQLQILGREQQSVRLRLPFERIIVGIGAALVPVCNDLI